MDNKCVVLASKGHTCFRVADMIAHKFGLRLVFVEDYPDISFYSSCIFVFSNRGDEELTEAFENYILSLKLYGKNYFLCELGNYFGFEYDYFGSRKIMQFLLDKLSWNEISSVSIDSTPKLDEEKLEAWTNEIHQRIDQQQQCWHRD